MRSQAIRLFLVAIVMMTVVAIPVWGSEKGIEVGLGYSLGSAELESGDDGDIDAITLLGRFDIASGWGVQTELRDGEDDEDIGLDYFQFNGYATYTWNVKDGMFRPFVKLGFAFTDVDDVDDGVAPALGFGVQIGSGQWAFHGGFDYTEPEIDDTDVEITHWTLGAVYRF